MFDKNYLYETLSIRVPILIKVCRYKSSTKIRYIAF
jgi:hypothetical protein